MGRGGWGSCRRRVGPGHASASCRTGAGISGRSSGAPARCPHRCQHRGALLLSPEQGRGRVVRLRLGWGRSEYEVTAGWSGPGGGGWGGRSGGQGGDGRWPGGSGVLTSATASALVVRPARIIASRASTDRAGAGAGWTVAPSDPTSGGGRSRGLVRLLFCSTAAMAVMA